MNSFARLSASHAKGRFFKKFFLMLMVCTLLSPGSTWAASLAASDLTAEGALLLQLNRQEILFQKNIYKRLYPASTTKLMTALLAVENLTPGRNITAPANFPYVGGSMIQIKAGETFTLEQLLEGLLVKSGNDAAALLAMEVSGSIDNFAALMNERAKELGCQNTNFVNPHGLHDPNHYTTVYDLSLIAQEVLRCDFLRQIIAMPTLTIPATNKSAIRAYNNTNRFLWDSRSMISTKEALVPIAFDLVQGIKTGTTREAGSCLTALARVGNEEYLAIGLKSKDPDIYRDLRLLFDYGLSPYEKLMLAAPSSAMGVVLVPNAKEGRLSYYTKGSYYTFKAPYEENLYRVYEVLNPSIPLPLKKGQAVGALSIQKDGVEIAKVPILASADLTPTSSSVKSASLNKVPSLIFEIQSEESPHLRLLLNQQKLTRRPWHQELQTSKL